MFLLLILACATDTTTTTDVRDTAAEARTDTGGADTDNPAAPGTTLVAHTAEGYCAQGVTQSVEMGTVPLQYTVEVKYVGGVAEQMQADILLRPNLLTPNAAWEDYESPLYRDGTQLVFTCGYAWERSGPTIDGEDAGPAVSYRAAWFTLE